MNANRGETINVHNYGFVRLIDWMGTDRDIVAAARVSYGAKSDHATILKRLKCETLAQAIAKHGIGLSENTDAWAQLEMLADFKLLQYLHKHKHVSPFEMCKIKFNIKMPIFVARQSYDLYKSLIAAGIAREQARIILPVGIYTEFVCCWDLNNLLKFFALRDDPHAQGEQAVARMCRPHGCESRTPTIDPPKPMNHFPSVVRMVELNSYATFD